MPSWVKGRWIGSAASSVLISVAVGVAAEAPRAALADPGEKHVLILNSYDPAYEWTGRVISGVRSVFDGLPNVELSIEFMDSKKVFTPAYAKLLAEIYAAKYRQVRFNLIVSSDDDALDFLRTYRDTLFPGVPVVLCGINNFEDTRIVGLSRVTVVNEAHDLDRNLAWIADLRPTTRAVVFLADDTATGRAARRNVDRIDPRWRQRFEVSVISDVTFAELAQRLHALAPETVVVWEMFMRDRSGRPLSMAESQRLVIAASPVPVFGTTDASVELGAVGGYVVSGFTQGETAARIGARILAGTPVEQIAHVRESPNRYMVNYPQFLRFGLDVAHFPPDTLVLAKPFSFYERYRLYVWAALGGMGAQSLVILVLLAAIRTLTRRGRIKLRESEERYRSIVDSATELICRFDPEGRILFANGALVRFVGAPGPSLDGQLYWDLIRSPAPDQSRLKIDALDHLTTTDTVEVESVQGSERRWVLWSYHKLFDPTGKLREVQAVGHDITARRQAERAALAALAQVEQGNADLARVNQDLRGILDSMHEGLVVCDREGRLGPIQSRIATEWFGAVDAPLVWDYLFPDSSPEKIEFQSAFEQVLEDLLPFELNVAQMPHRLRRAGRVYALDGHQVLRAGAFSAVVITIADITLQIEQEHVDQLNRELPAVIANLLRDRQGFQGFVEETRAMLATLVRTGDSVEARQILHTLKGTTATYGFESFAAACHALEGGWQEEPGAPAPRGFEALAAQWQASLARLGVFAGDDPEAIPLWRGDYDDLVARLERRPGQEDLLGVVRSWRSPRMAQVLAIYRRTVAQLAERLDKRVEAEVLDHGLRLPSADLRPFLATLVHVVRNATDHGIEPPEAREAGGKPRVGRVSIESLVDAGRFVVAVEDDGRGVDWDAVRAKAQREHLPSETQDDLIAALFTDRITTRDTLSEVSGRGVGLAAVWERCQQAGGEVRVLSQPGRGSRFEFRFPFEAAGRDRGGVHRS